MNIFVLCFLTFLQFFTYGYSFNSIHHSKHKLELNLKFPNMFQFRLNTKIMLSTTADFQTELISRVKENVKPGKFTLP